MGKIIFSQRSGNAVEHGGVYFQDIPNPLDSWEKVHQDGATVTWFCDDATLDFQQFCKRFNVVVAAGGRVQNENGEVLMMLRRGHWDLPKGKVDEGEELEEAAVREVKEECGLSEVRLIQLLTVTYHTYFHKNKWCIKPTYWYVMESHSEQILIPQLEEDITELKWVSPDDHAWQVNSYASILDVMNAH